MAELFGVKIPAISKHLSNIFKNGELQREATLSILETVQMEGARPVEAQNTLIPKLIIFFPILTINELMTLTIPPLDI